MNLKLEILILFHYKDAKKLFLNDAKTFEMFIILSPRERTLKKPGMHFKPFFFFEYFYSSQNPLCIKFKNKSSFHW